MNRRLSSLAIGLVAAGSVAASLSSCNAPSCGPGTAQQQQSDGTLKCVATDVPAPLTPCEVDGGNVVIVGGKCVSAIQCDPGTTMNINGICVGTSTGAAKCRTPAAGKACIDGTIYNFKDDKKGSMPIHVELYDPISLLSGGTPLSTYDSSDGSSYVFQDFDPPSLGLVAIVTGIGTNGFTPAGSAGQGIASSKYTIDTFEVLKADADKWGFDYATNGAFIAQFFKDPPAAAGTPQYINETMPVAGVTLMKDGANANAKYFDSTLTMVDSTLTVTGTSGTAIVASPVAGSAFPNFSGMGGGVTTWESHPGGSAKGLILILRFHPTM